MAPLGWGWGSGWVLMQTIHRNDAMSAQKCRKEGAHYCKMGHELLEGENIGAHAARLIQEGEI